MAKEFLGVGWKFPIGVDTKGSIRMSVYEEDIREAIIIILSTAKGERVMRPDFGCGIHDYTFEVMNSSVLGLIKSSIREALIKWEQRIEIIDIDVSTDEISNGKLIINIEYTVSKTNNRFNLVYPFYLTENKR